MRGRFNQKVWYEMCEHVGDVATERSSGDVYKSPNFDIPNPFKFTSLPFSYCKCVNMEKPQPKSASNTKFGKVSSQSAVSSGNSTPKGMTKDEFKQRSCDKSKSTQKSPTKENTKPVGIKLHTQQRAVKRAMFNYSVATKLYIMELQKKQVERVQKIIEEEEVRLLRKEMVPRAQLMPFFDRPFFPQRSNRPLTNPREPSFHIANSKCWSCICDNQMNGFQHAHAWKPIK